MDASYLRSIGLVNELPKATTLHLPEETVGRPGSAPARAAAPTIASSQPAAGLVLPLPPAQPKTLQDCTSLKESVDDVCKRRFVFRQGSEIYGGVGGFYTYGPPGCAMKVNLITKWRQHFVMEEQLMEIEDTCIMLHNVLKASGHVDRFNDLMVKDTKNEELFMRADKLLEDVMDAKMADKASTAAQKVEYEKVKNQADSYTIPEIDAIFKKYQIKSPETGNDLTGAYEFNLMFPASIGPTGMIKGYLRPETAQGIFINYKFCLEQNNGRMPFGIAQVGKAFRNEIAPRAGLTRQREFTQAEIEWFVNPDEKAHPKFAMYSGLKLQFFPSKEQLDAKAHYTMTIGEAVKKGIVDNETLGYFISRTALFLMEVGVHPQLLRFRQHLPTEMAHYAKDCWDAEIGTRYGWLECVGIADRSCFDLNAHAGATGEDLTVKKKLDTPIEVTKFVLNKKANNLVKGAFKKDSQPLIDYFESQGKAKLEQLAAEVKKAGSKELKFNADCGKGAEITVVLKPEHVEFESKVEKTSVVSYTPGVVEPSFGIDRILFSILEHAYYVRPVEKEENPKEKEKGKGDKLQKAVLGVKAVIAAHQVCILSLDQRIARHEDYAKFSQALRRALTIRSLSFTVDDSSATLGKRYARNDELGIPFAVTIDFDSMTDSQATVRERDSQEQIRLPLSQVPDLVQKLTHEEITWADAKRTYA